MANQFKKTMTTGIGETPIEIYATDASTRATVIGINIANTTESSIYVDLTFTDETSQTGYIVKGTEVPPGTALAAMGGDQKLVLEPNNSISLTSDTSASVDVIVSSLEIIT